MKLMKNLVSKQDFYFMLFPTILSSIRHSAEGTKTRMGAKIPYPTTQKESMWKSCILRSADPCDETDDTCRPAFLPSLLSDPTFGSPLGLDLSPTTTTKKNDAFSSDTGRLKKVHFRHVLNAKL